MTVEEREDDIAWLKGEKITIGHNLEPSSHATAHNARIDRLISLARGAQGGGEADEDQDVDREHGDGESFPARMARLAETDKYAALGRAAESNGLAWFAEDGSYHFQAPADVIDELAFQRGWDSGNAAPARIASGGGGEAEIAAWRARLEPPDAAPKPWQYTDGEARPKIVPAEAASMVNVQPLYAAAPVSPVPAGMGELIAAARMSVTHLEAAAEQFGFYEDQHRQKHTEDGDAKAATNSWWAARLRTEATIVRAAIASTTDAGQADGGAS